MSFLIAAAGTGGHVYPGLSVAEALVDRGVAKDQIVFIGGSRLEKEVYPGQGYPFVEVELRGLRRELTLANLSLPMVVWRARRRVMDEMRAREVEVALAMGGYVTIPTGLAASAMGVVFMNAEQNARAGLANRVASRWARRTFGAFPTTGGLPDAEWVGNPLRRPFWHFDRDTLRPQALGRYRLHGEHPVLGVVGGSLGAGALNVAVSTLVASWDGPAIDLVHLTGPMGHGIPPEPVDSPLVDWRRIGFESEMELFFAAVDLVVARAGGAVAELTATATPAVLVPGRFGSGRHQRENAEFLADSGAAIVVEEEEMGSLPDAVARLLSDDAKLAEMRTASAAIAKPAAALAIADEMLKAAA